MLGILLTQSASGWKAVRAPLPKGASSPVAVDLYDVSCPAAGRCLAVGDYTDVTTAGQSNGDTQGLVETLRGGKWTATRANPPADADFHPQASLAAVSCPTVTSCVAVGVYAVSGQPSAWILAASASGWKSMDAPTPNSSGGGGFYGSNGNPGLNDVDCYSEGRCAAVGSYQNGSSAGALFDQESGGAWKAINVPHAALAYLSYVACPAASNCEAVGGIAQDNGNLQRGFALSDTSGTLKGGETPLPAGVSPKLATEVDIYSIACPSTTTCSAVGAYYNANALSSSPSGPPGHALLLSLSADKWTAPAIPVSAAVKDGELEDLACRGSGCVAVGQYVSSNAPHALLITGSGNTWSPASVGGQSRTGAADLQAVSCSQSGACTASGAYADSAGNLQGVFASSTPGGWIAREAPAPVNAGAPQGIEMANVACALAGSCVALGTNQSRSVIAETLSAGIWVPSILPKPSDINQIAQIDPTSLSCPRPGQCVATAVYGTAGGGTAGAIYTRSNDRWSVAKATLPSDAARPVQADLSSLSCPSASHCVAAGYYVDTQEHFRGWILAQSAGGWTPLSAPAPPNAAAGDEFALTGVSCRSNTQCAAVGVYGKIAGPDYPLIVTGSGQSWSAGDAPLPKNAAGGSKTGAELTSVGCSGGACTAIGIYQGKSGAGLGLILSQAGTKWVATDAPVPDSQFPFVSLSAVSCLSTGCVVVGSYDDNNGGSRAVIITGLGASWKSVTPTTGAPPEDSALTSVVCLSAGACQAGGVLAPNSSDGQFPLLASSSRGKWALARIGLPARAIASSAGQDAYLGSEACPRINACVAVGDYLDIDYAMQGLIAQQK